MNKKFGFDGLMLRLGDLAPDTIISESLLAQMVGGHIETIRRWRKKRILPESMYLGNTRVWTVRCLLAFFNKKMDDLQRTIRAEQKRLAAV